MNNQNYYYSEFQKLFSQPTKHYKAKPFWAWNGKLDAGELKRQIQVFKEMGFGGFFMHSRTGLATEYLSEEWFSLIQACVDEARKNGMEAWLYDEDRWPSGYAGGFATKDPSCQLHFAVLKIFNIDDYQWLNTPNAFVFIAEFEDKKIKSYNRLMSSKELEKSSSNNKVLEFTIQTQQKNSWYNGQTYLDTLNKDAVKQFINITHEKYKQQIGENFGSTVRGIFTDEPFRGALFRDFSIWGGKHFVPWTKILPEFFEKKFGYDLTEHLPELFFNFTDKRYSHARYAYHRCLTMLFIEAFPKQLGQWCKNNQLMLTGHVLEEDTLCRQVSTVGATMQFYAHMQIPGIDILTRDFIHYFPVKQCVSVARQMGRKQVLSELYGCTGWDMTCENYKHNGDWQAALGVNFRCHHLSWYTMAGEAKRDYPGSIHFHSPWHNYYHYLEDYFSRINVFLSEGKPVCNIAVIHPIESFYLRFHQDWDSDQALLTSDQMIADFVNSLVGLHFEFDFIDEQLLIDNSAAVAYADDKPSIQVGEMQYQIIIVPGTITLRDNTFDLLKNFQASGGEVVFTERSPELLNGKPDYDIQKFASSRMVDSISLFTLLDEKYRLVSIKDETGNEISDIICQHRMSKDSISLFIANINRKKSYDSVKIEISADFNGLLQYWDAKSGAVYHYHAHYMNGKLSFYVKLPSSGSAMFKYTQKEEKLPLWNDYKLKLIEQINPENWSFSLDDFNVLVLDRPGCIAFDEQKRKFSKEHTDIIYLDDKLREFLNLPERGGAMNQPWVSKKEPLGNSAQINLRYNFVVESFPHNELKLAIEQPENWDVFLNGKKVLSTPFGWWVDPAIKILNIPVDFLREGENILELKGIYNQKIDLEAIYLLGDFGVRTNGITNYMTAMPQYLRVGNWGEQGLPFYSGNVTYATDFQFIPENEQKYFLKMANFSASALEIKINDDKPIFLGWPPYELDVTNMLISGSNTIKIQLFGSRKNSFGPLHVPGNPPFVLPLSYKRDDKEVVWREEYQLKEYGLMVPPGLFIQR